MIAGTPPATCGGLLSGDEPHDRGDASMLQTPHNVAVEHAIEVEWAMDMRPRGQACAPCLADRARALIESEVRSVACRKEMRTSDSGHRRILHRPKRLRERCPPPNALQSFGIFGKPHSRIVSESALLLTALSRQTLRFSAEVLPRLATSSYSTVCPSLSEERPAFSTAEI